MNPRQALAGEKPRLIDEWQKVPEVWNNIKEDLDEDYQFGKYILTGSTTIEDMDAWNPNIRSKTSIRSTPTRHFVDTSIACRALRIGPEDLMNDLDGLGFFFEDMAVRDLRVYSSVINGEVRHYRDNTGLECDAVIHLEDGRWAAIEVKLGGDKLVEEGAASLLRLKKKLEEKSDEPNPEFLMILTATGAMYQRPDGVIVMPINCLKA